MSARSSIRRFVMNGDVQLALECQTEGDMPVLFVHGWISSRRMWDDVVDRLGERYRALRFDFRGCGESDRPAEGHTLDGYASDLRAVLAAIDEPVTIVAHSMGARVAQLVATEGDRRISRMLLLAPGIAAGSIVIPRQRELAARAYGSRRRLQAFQRGAMSRDVSPRANERLLEDALIAQHEHWFGWYDVGRPVDFRGRLDAIRIPVRVLAGETDPLIPVARLEREILARIEGSELSVVAGAGHNLPIEAPDDVVEALERLQFTESTSFPGTDARKVDPTT